MTFARRPLAVAVAVLLAAGVASAPLGSAAPGGSVAAQPMRSFELLAGAGFRRLEVRLVQARASAYASAGTSLSTGGSRWTACVHGWTADSFVHTCSEVDASAVSVPEGSASGRLRFRVEDGFWGDTADVDLVLRHGGGVPDVGVSATPYARDLGVSASPQAWVSRRASATGRVVLTTVRSKRAAVRRSVAVSGTAVDVREALTSSAFAGA